MEDDAFGLAPTYDPHMGAKQQAHRAYLSGNATNLGRSADYADVTKSPDRAPMSVQIIQRLKEAMETTLRVQSVLNEKHHSLFGHPAPSAPAQLRGESPAEPEGFDAQVRSILTALNERLADVESAAQSLSARI